jgi:putative inorganic carbon (HCO3(-)) transporter
LAAVVAWFRRPADGTSLNHFAGLALGILAMGIVATWSRTERRMILMTALFALAATAVVVVGLAGTSIQHPKVLPMELASAMMLRLPGLQGSEEKSVNPNAVGGTAVLVAPMLIALALLPRRRMTGEPRLRPLAVVAAAIAMAVAIVSQSRSAWLAAAVVAVIALIRFASRGWMRVVIVALLAIGAAIAMMQYQSASPPAYLGVHEFGWIGLRISAVERVGIWRYAVAQIASSPLWGIGINAFHLAHLGPPFNMDQPVAHAHNILLQVALDFGLVGLLAYIVLQAMLLSAAFRSVGMRSAVSRRIAAGAGLTLVAALAFGAADAIALGAKVGIFQWAASGLILAAGRLCTHANSTT